jgi:hypothetical protein
MALTQNHQTVRILQGLIEVVKYNENAQAGTGKTSHGFQNPILMGKIEA